jgi:scyllo-inositol 2-dehydrogenase (NADP+)
MSNNKIGVGIVGFGPGSASQTFHIPLLEHEPVFDVKIVSTKILEESRQLLPEKQVVESPEEVINHPEVSLVVVATPNAWHFEYAKKALEAGKHVVIEKPLALTVKEVDELITLANRKNVVLSQFHNRRWDAGFLTVKKLMNEKRFGKINFFEMHYDRFEPNLSGNWREDKLPGNGVFFDLGVHLLDQALDLFGRPQSVFANLQAQRDPEKAYDFFTLLLNYGDVQVELGANLLAAIPGPRYRVSGSKGTFVKAGATTQDPQAGQLLSGLRPGDPGWGEDEPERYGVFSDGQNSETIPTLPGAYQTFYNQLGNAIAKGVPQPVPVEDARDIIAIIEAAERSHETGRRIMADEIQFLSPPVKYVVQ